MGESHHRCYRGCIDPCLQSSTASGGGVDWITSSTRDFAVLDACEFVVLEPKVGLEYFRRCCEPEQRRVSRSETAACSRRSRMLLNSPAPIVPAPSGE